MTWFYFIKAPELTNFSNMFLCVIIRECKLYMKYVECCKTHFFMSTVKQFELSGAFLSRSLMALSLDISFARFFISIFICFIFFLMAKILDICYARTSQQLQKLFSVTHLKKSWSMSKSSTQLNWIVDISFPFSCLCNRNGNALNEIGINDDNICQSCFLCPMGNSEEKWKAIKKLNFLKVKAKWTDSTSERKVPLSLHFPPVPSLGLVVFVILFLEDKDFMVTKMWLLKMNPTFYYKPWTKRTRKLCDNISKARSIAT